MALGKPSITTPNKLDQRSIAMAVENIRQRIEALESQLTTTTNVAGSIAGVANTQLNVIRQQIAALQAAVASLGGLVGQTAGIEVWTGAETITRAVVPGTTNVSVDNGDGVSGNIIISVADSGGGDVTQYDNEGRAAVTSEGGAIIMASGA